MIIFLNDIYLGMELYRFNIGSTILFGLPRAGKARLLVFDLLGRQVAEIVNESLASGHYSVRWNGMNDLNQQVSSGMYIYKLVTDEQVLSRKMLLLG